MNFYVYILYATSFNKTYVGQTNNIKNRLHSHNNGKVRSTKAYTPWDLIHYEILTTRAEAMKKENGLNRNPGEKRSLKFLIIIFTIIQPTETNGFPFWDH